MIDAHIHLEQYDVKVLPVQLEKWQEAGVKGVIAVSNDLPSSYRTLELRDTFPNFVHAAVGFHPEQPLPVEHDFLEWTRLVQAERKKIVAIGEIGLPHYNLEMLPSSLEHYCDFLSQCLEIAVQHQLPVALHAVHDKAEMVFDLLQKKQVPTAHFHWLKASENVVKKIVDAGYYISVTPEVCYRTRDQKLAKQVPLSQLLIETDGPWPYEGEFKNQATTPLFLGKISSQLATLYEMYDHKLQEQLVLNTHRCYQETKSTLT
ncbi:TatD family hydrolase [Fredinandcohnia sp. QZ13]|uniref:TatD family hydrolase n=1 Tax=Fredinandcohnia sp. QZ13 TaxID=3073144 RepID=UPI002853616B|nr:TatD family hydrolase [Fredinandcohnia sp. QZ13]MDR4886828.1 TatD family hydrolase [Fredinandcohnia sp. QZ13]